MQEILSDNLFLRASVFNQKITLLNDSCSKKQGRKEFAQCEKGFKSFTQTCHVSTRRKRKRKAMPVLKCIFEAGVCESPHVGTLNACMVCVFFNLLHKWSHHLSAVFPHTLWLAPLTAFGNVCLQSLASLHLEHAPGKLPDLCAARLLVISRASAPLGPLRMVQLSVLCHGEAGAVISALDSPAVTAVRLTTNYDLQKRSCFPLVILSLSLIE